MKKILLILVIFVSTKCLSQSISSYFEKYPKEDTLKCHFLEVINDSSYQWQSGYVIRNNGSFSFGEGNKKTLVEKQYLPLTSGVVTSPLFYDNMLPIRNYAIQIVIKPIGKKETTVLY